jgi:hypothetical protein
MADLDHVEMATDRLHVGVRGERPFVRVVPLRREPPAGEGRKAVPRRGLLEVDEAQRPDDPRDLRDRAVEVLGYVMEDGAASGGVEGPVPEGEGEEGPDDPGDLAVARRERRPVDVDRHEARMVREEGRDKVPVPAPHVHDAPGAVDEAQRDSGEVRPKGCVRLRVDDPPERHAAGSESLAMYLAAAMAGTARSEILLRAAAFGLP